MNNLIACHLIAISAVVGGAAARAETGSEIKVQPMTGLSAPDVAVARPPQLARPPSYAPEAAKKAARMAPDERDDRVFIRAAAIANRFETDAAQLAIARSKDPMIRAFAQETLARTSGTQVELQYLLQVRGMALPLMDNDFRKTLKHLATLSGKKFDRDYIELVALRFRREAVPQYEKVGVATRDPSLRAWIGRQLPVLRGHLFAAEKIAPAPLLPSVRTVRTQPMIHVPVVARAALVTQTMGASGDSRVSASNTR